LALILAAALMAPARAQNDEVDDLAEKGYKIDKPGTITFTVGVKIVGKVERPQVVIFLPKERSLFRPIVYSRSFSEEIMTPLEFHPAAVTGKK